MASKKEFGRLSDAEMKRMQVLAVMLKSFFSSIYGKELVVLLQNYWCIAKYFSWQLWL